METRTLQKICTKCKISKDIIDFYNDKRKLDGKHSWCKACVNIGIKKNYDYRKVRARRLDQQYGISIDTLKEMVEVQGGKCAICQREFGIWQQGPQVDHCHRTGRVRGILCTNCNIGLGRFKDLPDILRRAADYLENHSDQLS